MTEPAAEPTPATAPNFTVMRLGDWTPRRSPLDGVPQDLLDAAALWLRDGGVLTDPRLAAIMHAQHVALIRTMAGAMDKVDALLQQFHATYREAQPSLGTAMRLSEAYERGYQMGRVVELDHTLAGLQQVQHELQRYNEAAAQPEVAGG